MNAAPFIIALVLFAGSAFVMEPKAADDQEAAGLAGETEGELLFTLRTSDAVVRHLHFAPEGQRLVLAVEPKAGDRDPEILVLDASGSELYRFPAKRPLAICFSPQGTTLAVLTVDSLIVHDLAAMEQETLITRTNINRHIRALAFSDDGQVIVGRGESFDEAHERMAWDAKTGEEVAVPEGIAKWCGTGFSPDGRLFFSGGWPGPTPRVFNVDSGEYLTYCYRDPWPIAGAFTPDSKTLATMHTDGVLVFWEIKDTGGNNAKQLRMQAGFDNCTSFAISPDGNRIAYADKNGRVRLHTLAGD